MYETYYPTHYTPKSKRARAQIEKARFLVQVQGFHAAADYLRKKAWSLEAALFILLGR